MTLLDHPPSEGGRELDLRIAREIMGLRCEEWADEGDWWVTDDGKAPADDGECQELFWWRLPQFSESMSDAFLVVEKIPAWQNISIVRRMDGQWCVSLITHPDNPRRIAQAVNKSAPLAICLAALKAVEGGRG